MWRKDRYTDRSNRSSCLRLRGMLNVAYSHIKILTICCMLFGERVMNTKPKRCSCLCNSVGENFSDATTIKILE